MLIEAEALLASGNQDVAKQLSRLTSAQLGFFRPEIHAIAANERELRSLRQLANELLPELKAAGR